MDKKKGTSSERSDSKNFSIKNSKNFNTDTEKNQLENLPREIALQARYFPCEVDNGIKKPLIQGWNLPGNQKTLQEVTTDKIFVGYVGLDIEGYNLRDSLLFLDFDHILIDGRFVNDTATEVVKNLQLTFPDIYIEYSISGTGLHAFLKPTNAAISRFGKLSKGKNATLYFDAARGENSPKLEIFYNTNGRFCLVTGNKFSDGANIPHGEEVDEFLNSLLVAIKKVNEYDKEHTQQKQNSSSSKNNSADFKDPPEYRRDLILAMVNFLEFKDLPHDEWLPIFTALIKENFSREEIRNLCVNSSRYTESQFDAQFANIEERAAKENFGIETIIGKASQQGFDFKGFKMQWYQTHTEFSSANFSSKNDSSQTDELRKKLAEVQAQINNFNARKNSAIETCKNADSFERDKVFADDFLTAAAFARLYDGKVYSDVKAKIQNTQNKNSPYVADWAATVKSRAKELQAEIDNILAERNKIQAEIKNAEFIKNNSAEVIFEIPEGYSLSAENGIEKIVGKDVIQICRRVIVIKGIVFSVEEQTSKIVLGYKNKNQWHNLPPFGAGTIFNTRKIVDLADFNLSVTSVNAKGVVEFLDALKCLNENKYPLKYEVSRCGWQKSGENEIFKKDIFVDPRRENIIDVDDKKVEVVVDFANNFSKYLKSAGTVEEWKKAYDLAKTSPIARLIVAAAVASPLLKIIGERNFVLYFYGKTRGGKSTALLLGASTVGTEEVVLNFDGTNNGFLAALAETSDYPFCVDEKQAADNRLQAEFQNFIYRAAEGKERTRANRDGTSKPIRRWRNITIANGETPLLGDNATGGAHTRLLAIPTPDVILDPKTCKDIRDIITDNYGVVYPAVIDKIFAYGFDHLRDMFNTTLAKIVETSEKHNLDILNEYYRYMAVLTVADTVLNRILGVDDTTSYTDALKNTANILPLIPTTEEISDTRREKNFVLSFIAQNQRNFINATDDSTVEKIQKVMGIFDGGYTFIIAEVLQQACKEKNFDYQKLVGDLVADKFFEPANRTPKGRKNPPAVVQKKINKVNSRCLRIPKNLVETQESDA